MIVGRAVDTINIQIIGPWRDIIERVVRLCAGTSGSFVGCFQTTGRALHAATWIISELLMTRKCDRRYGDSVGVCARRRCAVVDHWVPIVVARIGKGALARIIDRKAS